MKINYSLSLYWIQLRTQRLITIKKIITSKDYSRDLWLKFKRIFPYFNFIARKGIVILKLKFQSFFPPAIPAWALEEMKELGQHIDPMLYPTKQFVSKCKYHTFPMTIKPGLVYGELLKQCSLPNYTHGFILPWLKRGGADLVSLLHIEFIARCSKTKTLVLLTEPGDSPWLSQLPTNVDVLNIADYITMVSHNTLLQIMVKLLLQLKIEVLHVINSKHAWEAISQYGLALTQQMRIFTSVYCDDYDKCGKPVGFAREYLLACSPFIQKVFTDNRKYPALLQQCYGFPATLFQVIKTPAHYHAHHDRSTFAWSKQADKVLWAGRLDRQKRPDILLAIALNMPDIEFHVYGDSLLDGNLSLISQIKNTKNIWLHGAFEGVDELPFSDFPVFLYTSSWDGTPTTLIAAAAAAIPVVASLVGGVSEIITEKTGYPITDIECIDSYIKALRTVLQDSKEANSRALYAQEYIKREHNQLHFERALVETSGYVAL